MDKTFLENLSEDSQVELKTCANKLPASFWETYSSFANCSGGTIYLGIEEEKKGPNKLTGIKNPEEIKKVIFDTANNHSKVSTNLLTGKDIESVDIDGHVILAVHVRPATTYERPVYIDGNPFFSYRRDGESDHRYSEAEVRTLLTMSVLPSQSLDFAISSARVRLSELDDGSLRDYRKLYESLHGSMSFSSLSNEEFFSRVGALRKEGKEYFATNAGLLAFGNANLIRLVFPNYFLDYTLTDGQSSKWNERFVSDDPSWSGSLYSFVKLLNMHLNANLSAPFLLKDGLNVGKSLLFQAVREAVLNAVFNADFSLPGGIKVALSPREVLVRNPGYLMLPLERAMQGGFSNPRNPCLATIFRSIEYGDRAGSGIPTMFSSLHELSYPDPVYREDPDLVATEVRIVLVPGLGDSGLLLRALASSRDGFSIEELQAATGFGRKKILACLDELLGKGLVVDNGRKTKGRKFLKSWSMA